MATPVDGVAATACPSGAPELSQPASAAVLQRWPVVQPFGGWGVKGDRVGDGCRPYLLDEPVRHGFIVVVARLQPVVGVEVAGTLAQLR